MKSITKNKEEVKPPRDIKSEVIIDLDFHCTDVGNGQRLIHRFGAALRYSWERKTWLFWQGKHWEWDSSGQHITFLAKETAIGILDEAKHAQMAEDSGAFDLPRPVRRLMKLTASAMKAVAYRV